MLSMSSNSSIIRRDIKQHLRLLFFFGGCSCGCGGELPCVMSDSCIGIGLELGDVIHK